MKIKDGIWCAIAAFWLAVLFVTAIFLTQIMGLESAFPETVTVLKG